MDDALVYGSDRETHKDHWKDGLRESRDVECSEERIGPRGWVRKERLRRVPFREVYSGESSPEKSLESPKQKFMRLRDAWKAGRGHCSDTVTLVIHPAYQSIIGMGYAAVPFLLQELAASRDRWYWALRAITEEDPVPEEARGNSKAMAQAWLDWGKERGYQC